MLVGGRHRIVRFIAEGGMGEVYEAEDLELKERVALKTLLPDVASQTGLERFKREIHIARKVTHPNVCRIFDVGHHRLPGAGETTDIVFLTMELLAGETLGQRVKRVGRMSPSEALPFIQQMAAALDLAHELGIVHRDFKSPNVILVPGKHKERAVVTDFGLARGFAGGSSSGVITGTGEIVGTPAYMAPEQVEGKPVGPPADLYALGVVIYEMVTGAFPFPGDSALSIAVKRLQEKPVPPHQVVADLDPVWEAVILRCLERDPRDRFATAGDVVRALQGEAIVPTRRTSARRTSTLAVSAAAALAVAALGAYVLSRRASVSGPAPASAPQANPLPAAGERRRSVAVLGFQNLGRAEAGWLSTAISEMLRTELAAGGKVRTIPGESVSRMKRELSLEDAASLAPDTLARIRTNVDADLVVLGSYLAVGKAAGKLRLNLNVQDAAKGELVASAAVEGSEEEVLALVSQAGAKLREDLGLGRVSATEASAARAAFPKSPEAAQLYSEGLVKLHEFDALEARALLEKAAAVEPKQPLIQAALATAWSALGYDAKARDVSAKAVALAKDLGREERLTIEGLHHETAGEWDRAVETHKALVVFFPDKLDYGLRLAAAQAKAGKGEDSLATVAALRKLPPPSSEDPRTDLAEAEAAKALTDFPRQLKAASGAAEKAGKRGARLLLAQALLLEGSALANLGRLDEARKACEEAVVVFAAAEDRGSVARAENVIAVTHARAGELDPARERFERALKASREIGDRRGTATHLANVGNVLVMQGKLAEAKKLYADALSIFQEIGDRSGSARAMNNLANVLERMNDLEAARKTYEQVLEAYQRLGETRNVALVTTNIGEVLAKQGRVAPAREKYEAALALSRQAGDKSNTAATLSLLAKIFDRQGESGRAEKALEEALSLYRATEEKAEEAGVLRQLAALLERTGDKASAKTLSEQAARIEKELEKGS